MDNSDFDQLLRTYRQAVDAWIGAIRAEESLATGDHSCSRWRIGMTRDSNFTMPTSRPKRRGMHTRMPCEKRTTAFKAYLFREDLHEVSCLPQNNSIAGRTEWNSYGAYDPWNYSARSGVRSDSTNRPIRPHDAIRRLLFAKWVGEHDPPRGVVSICSKPLSPWRPPRKSHEQPPDTHRP